MAWEEIKSEKDNIISWDQSGEILIGKLKAIKPGKYGNIYELEKEDGEMAEFYGTTVLDEKLGHCLLDDHIKIIYLGLSTGENKYKRFQVFVNKDLPREEIV